MESLEVILKVLIDKLGEEVVVASSASPQLNLEVDARNIREVCKELYTNEQTYFDYLNCITGIDNGEKVGTMEVIYNLTSIPFERQLMLKVTIPREGEEGQLPQIPTISDIWRTANWHERETYDLLGIEFTGHPDMRRILLPQDWEGHPLRKDYEHQEKYHGIRVEY